MSEIKSSERAGQVLAWMRDQKIDKLTVRQASLGEILGCSRWTIGRALKCLEQAGLIVESQKRGENRCKVYEIMGHPGLEPGSSPAQDAGPRLKSGVTALTPVAQLVWERYQRTYAIVFKVPDLKERYEQVARELVDVTTESEMYCQAFRKLMREANHFRG